MMQHWLFLLALLVCVNGEGLRETTGGKTEPMTPAIALDSETSDRDLMTFLRKLMQNYQKRKEEDPAPSSEYNPIDGSVTSDKRSTSRCRQSSIICQALYGIGNKRGLSSANDYPDKPAEYVQPKMMNDEILDKRVSTSRCRNKNALICQSQYIFGTKRDAGTPRLTSEQILLKRLKEEMLRRDIEEKYEELQLLQQYDDIRK